MTETRTARYMVIAMLRLQGGVEYWPFTWWQLPAAKRDADKWASIGVASVVCDRGQIVYYGESDGLCAAGTRVDEARSAA